MTSPEAAGALAGLRVLDLTEHMAGPYCTMILGDMGAEIIKVERPGRGDSVRAWGDGTDPRNPYFLYINRNKKSLTLDYKTEAGRALFLALAKQVDVLVENYRPTVMIRAGLGYDALKAHNPRLIYASLSGFGYDGPYQGKGGFDLIAQAMGGIMHVTGEPDGPPTSVGLPLCDLGTGTWAVTGILAALHARERTGRGQRVECSLLETAVALSSWTSAGWLADHKEPERQGSRHRQNTPYQRFDTQNGHLMMGAGTQALWERMCEALGQREWITDPRFVNSTERMAHRPELEALLQALLIGQPTEHWMGLLDEAGVPCGPVHTYAQLFNDPQVRHREMVTHCEDEELGRVPHLRTPVRLSEDAVAVRQVAPRLGQHTEALLSELGYDTEQIARLRSDKVI